MTQFQVKIFQQARINTETFIVEADSPEQAQVKVREEELVNKDLVNDNQPFEVEISEFQQTEPVIGEAAPSINAMRAQDVQ